MVLILGPLLLWRYDLFPACLSLLAFCAVLAKRPAWAGFWLGAAIGAKLYPIVLVPIFCAYYFTGHQFRALRILLLSTTVTLLVPFLPFLSVPPSVTFSFVRYHALRGLQLESVPAGILMLARSLGLADAETVFNYGAVHITSPLAPLFLHSLLALFLLAAAVICGLAVRRFRAEFRARGAISSSSLLAFCLAMLLAFMATNKVFSPQYIIWALPFVAVLPFWPRCLGMTLCVMTILIFPFNYSGLMDMDPPEVALLNLRNLLVIVLAVWLVRTPRSHQPAPVDALPADLPSEDKP